MLILDFKVVLIQKIDSYFYPLFDTLNQTPLKL